MAHFLSPGAAKGCKPRLSSPLFKLGARLVRGLNGSVWSGASNIMYHLRTLFELGTPMTVQSCLGSGVQAQWHLLGFCTVKNPNDRTLHRPRK